MDAAAAPLNSRELLPSEVPWPLQVRIRIPNRPVGPLQSASSSAVPLNAGQASAPGGLGASVSVALGIFGSRITGLIRERYIGRYFGVETLAADAFRAAFRIPSLLSILFGEGVLSAAFVTVYSKLRALQEDEEADHLAAAIFGILALVCSLATLIGVLFTPLFIDLIAPGFHGEKRLLTIQIVRILFPGTAVLVMSAWCLGVLNSHRRFLLSYLSPVVVNATVIAALVLLGHHPPGRLVLEIAWSFVIGYALQFLVQFPRVLRIIPAFRPVVEWHSEHVRSVIRNFGPVFLSRGVVQISGYIDQMIASNLPLGSVAILGYAQAISILPFSLFSMSISAAELPALSSAVGTPEEISDYLRRRLSTGLRRIAFFIVPSAVGFLVLGDVIGAALYQGGRFTHENALYLWAVLAGSSVGLLATSLGRLYSSAFYALLDTRTPLRFAIVRVTLTTVLGLACALFAPHWLGIDQKWGAAGLTASAGIAGWVEFALLRRALHQRIGDTGLRAEFTLKLWAIAFLGGAAGFAIKILLGAAHPVLLACLILPAYGAIYFGGATLLGIPEARSTLAPLLRRAGLR